MEEVVKEKKEWFNTRRLTLPGLKPSDYFLFKECKEFFSFDTRQVLVLGLRIIYAAFHDPRFREMVFHIAKTVKAEDLSQEQQRPTYTTFSQLLHVK